MAVLGAALTTFAVTFLQRPREIWHASGAVSTALAYLAKSPLPPIAEEDTDFTTKEK